MKTRLFVVLAALAFAVSACGDTGSPTAPAPSVSINPLSTSMVAGEQKCFSSSESGTWSLPMGGGTLNQATGTSACVTAGNTAGTYPIRVQTGKGNAEASFQVMVIQENSIELISCDPPPGTGEVLSQRINCRVRYASVQNAYLVLDFADANRQLVSASGSFVIVGRETDEATVTGQSRGQTEFVSFRFVSTNLKDTYYTSPYYPATYLWATQ